MTQSLLFRADADEQMGSGHIMRLLAIAEAAIGRGLTCHFAIKTCPDELRLRLSASGIEIHDLPSTDDLAVFLALIAEKSPRAVVIDGYEFDETYRRAIKGSAPRVLAMDDGVSVAALHADIVVNTNPAAADGDYAESAAGAELLLGLAFATLRTEFVKAATASSASSLLIRERSKILVTFGGSDPLGLSGPVTKGLLDRAPADVGIDLVLGGAHPDLSALTDAAEADNRLDLHVDSQDMASLMANAGMAISAAGSTSLELAALGVPSLLAVTADNQAAIMAAHKALEWCEGLDARGPDAPTRIVELALTLWDDKELRQGMAEKAAELVDGKGADRIVDALTGFTDRGL